MTIAGQWHEDEDTGLVHQQSSETAIFKVIWEKSYLEVPFAS